LREKYEDGRFDKPTSICSSFKGGRKSQNAKRSKKIKNQLVGPLDEKEFE
jgi:hypothetical protein